VGQLGFVINENPPVGPADCGSPYSTDPRQGYGGTTVRAPSDLSPKTPNTAAHCDAAASTGVNVRGAQNAPGGDPISTGTDNRAYPRGTTANTVRVGSTDGSAALLGDRSWIALLTDGLH
jgi:phospholipid/cholesterol/gamma-HCH transport system substrate-binding protein